MMINQGAAAVLFLLASINADDVEVWGQWETTWIVQAAVRNPFVDVDLFVKLTPPGSSAAHQPVNVRGFYDGDGQYKARFMPPTAGKWNYVTKCNVQELDGRRGTFTAHVPEVGKGRGANHGPVVAKPGQTKFAYADGTPFLSVATTVYGMFLKFC